MLFCLKFCTHRLCTHLSYSFMCCPLSCRKPWAPLKQRWLWTGTSARPCCRSWLAVPLCSPAPSTTHSWSTPRCRPSTGCPKAARWPRPRETPSSSACWRSASKSCELLHLTWRKTEDVTEEASCYVLCFPSGTRNTNCESVDSI